MQVPHNGPGEVCLARQISSTNRCEGHTVAHVVPVFRAVRETEHVQGRSPFVPIEGLANFRDVGGFATPNGTVRRGRLYRSDGLHQVSESGLAELRALGCVTVFDLRTTPELDERPGPLPVVHLPLHEELGTDDIADAMTITGHGAGVSWLESLYLLLLERATPQFRTIFALLADEARLPAIVHCAGGKDRTGITVALVLSALGVARDDVLDDFALQSPDPEWTRRRAVVHASFVERGMDADAAAGLVTAPRSAMLGALRFVDDAYGSVEGYLTGACGVEEGVLDALRANLLEPAR